MSEEEIKQEDNEVINESDLSSGVEEEQVTEETTEESQDESTESSSEEQEQESQEPLQDEVKEVDGNTALDHARHKLHKYEEDLKARFEALDNPQMAGLQIGISNASLFFDQQILANTNHSLADSHLKGLEESEAKIKASELKINIDGARKQEYLKIDQLLHEAIAEKEMGDDSRMKEYIEKRKAIKAKLPKAK